MSNSEHEWKFTGCHPHNGEYWYQCLKCGATDWIAHYGTMDQLKPEKCVPAVEEAPTTPANAPSYEDLVNALVQVRHATAPTPDDGGHHEAAHDIADAVLKRVATVQRAAPEPLACHVCGTTSEIHGQFCSVAPPPPLTKEERALLLHTLCGLEHDRPSYRNRYWVFPLSDPRGVLKSLVSRGLLELHQRDDARELLMYCATAAGAAAVGKTLPKD